MFLRLRWLLYLLVKQLGPTATSAHTTVAPQVRWVLFSGHVSSRYPLLLLNLEQPVVHKLLVVTIPSNPVNSNGAV